MLNQVCVLETSLLALLTEVLSDFFCFFLGCFSAVIHNLEPAANKLSIYSVAAMIHKMLSEAHRLTMYSNIQSFSIAFSWSCIFVDLSVLTANKKAQACVEDMLLWPAGYCSIRLRNQGVKPKTQAGWEHDDVNLCLLLQSLCGKFSAVIGSNSWRSSLIFVCLHRARGHPCDQEQRIV